MRRQCAPLVVCWLALLVLSCRQPKELVYQDIRNFKIRKVAMDNTVVSMDVRLYNPNHIGLKLRSADVLVAINNSLVGKVDVTDMCRIPARDTAVIPMVVQVNLKKVLPDVVKLLFNSEVDINLKGEMRAGSHGLFVRIPVNYTTREDILEGIQ